MFMKEQSILYNRFTWLYFLLFFPIIDYILRNIIPIPVVSSLWDEGLLLLLVGISLVKLLGAKRTLPSMKTPLISFLVLGIGFLVLDMKYFWVNVEGFRAIYQYMAAFLIGFYFFDSQKEAQKTIRILLIVAAIVGAYGLLQVVMKVPTPEAWADTSENITTRAFSIVQSPNILGSFMALMSPIAFGFAFAEQGKKRWFWVFLGFLMLGTLMFTYSRGAWLALAGAVGLISVFLNRKLLITLLIVAVLTAAFVPPVTSRINHLFSDEYLEKSSKDGRIARWLGAYDVMRVQPFYGVGLGHYGGAVGERNFDTIYVDSYYFKTLAEMGIVGLGAFLWLMGTIVRNGYQIWKTQRRRRMFYMYAGLLTGILAIVLHNAVENIFEVPFMNTYFWLVVGLALSFPYLEQDESLGGAAKK